MKNSASSSSSTAAHGRSASSACPETALRPAAVLAFGTDAADMVSKAQLRLNGTYWKGRQLHVQTILQR